MQRSQVFRNAQQGVSLTGLIFVMAVLGVVAVFAMKVFPTFMEYRAIKDGIAAAKATNGSPQQMRESFNKSADINGVDAISGKDLDISKDGGDNEISFAYEKRIPIAGNVSLVIDYAGTTASNGVAAPKPDTAAK
jgi:hypothetical protein